jgi:methylated-DNA-[protein]-cysteine S-methyltransferase
MTTHYAGKIPSPLGEIWAVVDDAGRLTELHFEGSRTAPESEGAFAAARAKRGIRLHWEQERLAHVAQVLQGYFAKRVREFDLEVAPHGTPFQQSVWKELLEIPYGTTRSYGELAARLCKPNASRAVGRANGTNPVSLVIPCHRVIGADGTLTGYGGGMDRKRALLALEQGQAIFSP